ncbi:hypothetical protein BAUCODRAFT_34270 [Baudoinia panamericana UAMH 10762]|uniref:Uncharacterized protein n=1 Tax=Baudoinia panamericana (strain UAMH 10762) TaxID=717646 RepID=M2NCG7_BAUPA|nr:uncharacterized protein BAUCODRAFT_34270 [Baudoinia panamericana UAMH 10762]EMC96874.1 hypothetical protein BAUCODRAFT_34270 [Baudoinia panamericana UAMH 10762]
MISAPILPSHMRAFRSTPSTPVSVNAITVLLRPRHHLPPSAPPSPLALVHAVSFSLLGRGGSTCRHCLSCSFPQSTDSRRWVEDTQDEVDCWGTLKHTCL